MFVSKNKKWNGVIIVFTLNYIPRWYCCCHYVDKNPFSGRNYYRLKQTDLDGIYAYSGVKMIDFNGSGLNIYPNPVGNSLIVDGLEGSNTIKLMGVSGQVIVTVVTTGERTRQLDFSSLPAGVYYIQVIKKTGENATHKVIKQ